MPRDAPKRVGLVECACTGKDPPAHLLWCDGRVGQASSFKVFLRRREAHRSPRIPPGRVPLSHLAESLDSESRSVSKSQKIIGCGHVDDRRNRRNVGFSCSRLKKRKSSATSTTVGIRMFLFLAGESQGPIHIVGTEKLSAEPLRIPAEPLRNFIESLGRKGEGYGR